MVDGLLTCDARQRWERTDEHGHDFQGGGGVLLGFGWHTERRVRGPTLGEVLKMGREGAEEHGYYCHVGFWMARPLTERTVRVHFSEKS